MCLLLAIEPPSLLVGPACPGDTVQAFVAVRNATDSLLGRFEALLPLPVSNLRNVLSCPGFERHEHADLSEWIRKLGHAPSNRSFRRRKRHPQRQPKRYRPH